MKTRKHLLASACLLALAAPAAAQAATPEYVVQFDGAVSARAERSLVARAGGRVTRQVRLIDAVGARLDRAATRRLRADRRVRAVSPNAAVHTTGKGGNGNGNGKGGGNSTSPGSTRSTSTYDAEAYLRDHVATAYPFSVKAEKLWLDPNLHATGRGVGVAVIDTGIAGDLPDFRRSYSDATSRVVASVVTNPDATGSGDGYGHGTHIAGLIAGNGFARPTGDPLWGRYAGTAPEADLISIKASDDDGNTTLLDVIYGLQFAVDHKADYNIRVVNLSLNSSVAESYRTDPLDAAVEQAWLHGIVVITAAGNRGTAADAVSYAPANDPYAIAVGGADDQGTKDVTDDALAAWSSRGTTQDGFSKPDLIAPGAHLVSLLAPGSDFASLCATCVREGGQYIQAGGTSMASAVLAGVAAQVIQVHPDWTPDMVKTALVRTFRPVKNMGNEIAADLAARADVSALAPVNVGLEPNSLIDVATGSVDPARASWSRASWSVAADPLRASWSRASWSCDCFPSTAGTVDPTRASWSRASWSRASWSMAWDK